MIWTGDSKLIHFIEISFSEKLIHDTIEMIDQVFAGDFFGMIESFLKFSFDQ